MELTLYQIDAFADQLFTGNPAAVCPLPDWLPDDTMQAIAMENNLAETGFFVEEDAGWRIRWFTPTTEVRLCGHATLASAYVYFTHMAPGAKRIVFNSHSGPLSVTRNDEWLTLDFPQQSVEPVETPTLLVEALGVRPREVHAADDWLIVLESETQLRELQPNMALLKQLERRGVIATAKGDEYDFVSRFFAPKYAIDEDPVTGSAHTKLAPFWAERLGRQKLHAKQLSSRGGDLHCEIKHDRVFITGKAIPYLEGTITLDERSMRDA